MAVFRKLRHLVSNSYKIILLKPTFLYYYKTFVLDFLAVKLEFGVTVFLSEKVFFTMKIPQSNEFMIFCKFLKYSLIKR